MNRELETIAIVGTGTIGSSWAVLFASHGLNVRMYDVNPASLQSGHANTLTTLERLLESRGASTSEISSARDRVRAFAHAEECLAGVDFIQESVLERYPVKREAHDLIERFAPSDAILATSSSGLLANQMQTGLKFPGRFLIAHPFNPPHLIPLVELVPGPQTSEDVLNTTNAFYVSLGKIPIVLRKEIPGHIANRLAAAVWREAIDIVANGAASLEDVDKALYAGPGLRWSSMGQHLIYHLNGGPRGYPGFFDHFGPQIETWLKDMAQWTTIPAEARAEVLRQMKHHVAGRTQLELETQRDKNLQSVLQALYPPKEQPVESL